ncbi:MAG: hypothetical protein KBH14_07165 [Vicinamibacteria bacterium]|jgi:hypothetical protein|nr:hypothetical protein [Vicinamibacteria bacterium]MBP9946157.1 hypothetical protein [Vicinamibacteria bacterium]
MKRSLLVHTSVLSLAAATGVLANDPPLVEHQPAQCSLIGKPTELCASVLDDGDIAKVRAYFRKPGEKEYLVTEMVFEGARFCATLPGVKPGKLRTIEYYIQATDTEYESKRTSTYQLQIQTEEDCPFPAVQKDAKKASSIIVNATSAKQKTKLPEYLDPTGVTFVPVPGAKN